MPVRPALDRAIDEAFVHGGYPLARTVATQALGWTPEDGQLDVAIGRNAWILGERRGEQGYQIRMARRGVDMPRLDPDGLGAEAVNGPADGRHFPSIDRHFGIEVEFNRGQSGGYNIQSRVVAHFQDAAGVDAEHHGGYTHAQASRWSMRHDGTVTGGEFVSPILSGIDGHNQVRHALRSVRECGGTPGQNQGMHIHHDVRDFSSSDLTRLINNLEHAQTALLNYVPAYRYNGSGSYRANLIPARIFGQLRTDVSNGVLAPRLRGGRTYYARYVSFNFNATLSYGSLEWRALGNTLNAVKIRTWIRVGQAFMWATKQGLLNLTATVTSAELMDELVRHGALPRREAERFMSIVTSRQPAVAA